jgi:hypothetical protein
LARASHLLKFGGDRRPYLVNLRDPRRRAASERRFFASSSSSSPWPRNGPSRPIEELPDILQATASPICARGGLGLQPTASNCGGEAEMQRGMRQGGDQFWTRIDPINRYISQSMRAPATAMGPGRPMRDLFCTKKGPNPQIGSDGAMRAEIEGLLKLL